MRIWRNIYNQKRCPFKANAKASLLRVSNSLVFNTKARLDDLKHQFVKSSFVRL